MTVGELCASPGIAAGRDITARMVGGRFGFLLVVFAALSVTVLPHTARADVVILAQDNSTVSEVASGPAAGQSAGISAQEEPVTFNVGYYDMPPVMQQVNGKPVGLFIDTTVSLAKEAGLVPVFTFLPPNRIYSNVEGPAGVMHAWISILSGVLLEAGLPVRPTIYPPVAVDLYGLSGNKPPPLAQLKATTLIAVHGFRYGGALATLETRGAGVQILAAATHTSAFRMLAAGRAPFLLHYRQPSSFAITKLDIRDIEVTPVSEWDLYLLISKKAPDANGLHAKLEQASERLQARRQRADPGARLKFEKDKDETNG